MQLSLLEPNDGEFSDYGKNPKKLMMNVTKINVTKDKCQVHIEKLSKCSDNYFVPLILITVKTDWLVKLARKLKEISSQIHKQSTKHQLSEKSLVSSMKHSARKTRSNTQLKLCGGSSNLSIFLLEGGKSTAIFMLHSHSYRISTMSAILQRVKGLI